jgi:peptide/nickel transport system permease protein
VKFLLQRMMFYMVAFWAALTLNYLLPHLAGGNPAGAIFQSDLPLYQHCAPCMQQLIAQYGDPNKHESFGQILSSYPGYLWNMLQLHLGYSARFTGTPVTTIIRQTLPYSILIAGTGLCIAFIVGSFIGMLCAWRRGGILDSALPSILAFLGAFPSFFLAILLVYVLALGQGPGNLHLFPPSNAYDTSMSPNWSWGFVGSLFQHAELPVIVLIVTGLSGWLLGMRNVMINNVGEEYITMARAKGLRDWRIMTMYAGRNSILPNFTGFAIGLGFVVAGTILIEFVFNYPGVGLALQQAATGSDYPTAQALLLVISVCVLGANFIMDSIYVILDPRTRVA